MLIETASTIAIIDGHSISLGASVKLVECKYKCGNLFVVTTMAEKPPHHVQCAIQAATDCVRQMHNHSGPYYERWLSGMARFIARHDAALGAFDMAVTSPTISG